MRFLPWMLVAATAAAPGCKVPDTLGLPCVTHVHCDPGQHCGPDGTCVAGMAPMPTPPTSGPVSTGHEPGTGNGTSSSEADTTLVLEGTSSGGGSTTTSDGSTGSTGQACGQAANSCEALDILFVIDNSGSMMEDNGNLIPALASVQELLFAQVQSVCSYHIGVTSTEPMLDIPAQVGCQVRGALSRGGALCPDGPWGDPAHDPWVSEEDDINTLGCLFGVLQQQEDDEKQLDTILAALGPALGAPGACNEGFVREGVPLLLVLVTDEDDDDDSGTPGEDADRTGSSGTPSDWWDALIAIKDPSQLAMVVVAPTSLSDCTWQPLPGDDDGTGAEYAQNLLELLGYFFGAGYGDHYRAVDLCQPVDDLLDQISVVEDIFGVLCESPG